MQNIKNNVRRCLHFTRGVLPVAAPRCFFRNKNVTRHLSFYHVVVGAKMYVNVPEHPPTTLQRRACAFRTLSC